MSRNGRVIAAMSGGVDSSVAAALLREQGYEVVGVFMRMGADEQGAGEHRTKRRVCDAAGADKSEAGALTPGAALPVIGNHRQRGCCSAVDAADARAVAARLGIAFYALNFGDDFRRLMDDFADEYLRGRTPNPCVRCNQWLKFGRLAAYAGALDAEWIATGHYARVTGSGADVPRLLRARDRRKDQSYVLFGVPPAVWRRTLLPLGDLTKQEVRAEARRLGLPVYDKPESQDICFVSDRDPFAFVSRRRPDALRPGPIRHVSGRELGRHAGVAAFTIGQRRGVRVAAGEPLYVSRIDANTATVTVGPRAALASRGLLAGQVNWLRDPPRGGIRAEVQIRYHHAGAAGRVMPQDDGAARVVFDAPVDAVTPGQAAVFYDGDEVLGGGWIERPLDASDGPETRA